MFSELCHLFDFQAVNDKIKCLKREWKMCVVALKKELISFVRPDGPTKHQSFTLFKVHYIRLILSNHKFSHIMLGKLYFTTPAKIYVFGAEL